MTKQPDWFFKMKPGSSTVWYQHATDLQKLGQEIATTGSLLGANGRSLRGPEPEADRVQATIEQATVEVADLLWTLVDHYDGLSEGTKRQPHTYWRINRLIEIIEAAKEIKNKGDKP